MLGKFPGELGELPRMLGKLPRVLGKLPRVLVSYHVCLVSYHVCLVSYNNVDPRSSPRCFINGSNNKTRSETEVWEDTMVGTCDRHGQDPATAELYPHR